MASLTDPAPQSRGAQMGVTTLPIYKTFDKKNPDKFRVISAPSAAAAIKHYLGEDQITAQAITDASQAAELVSSGHKLEKAGEPTPATKSAEQQAADEIQTKLDNADALKGEDARDGKADDQHQDDESLADQQDQALKPTVKDPAPKA